MKKTISMIAFGLLSISLSAQIPNYVPTNGLVGWYPFNGNANDESATGFNGTVNGALLTADRFGNANRAYNFNGTNNYISLPLNAGGLAGLTQFSMSYWVNSSQSSGVQQTVYSYWVSAGPSNQPSGFYTNIINDKPYQNYISNFQVGNQNNISTNNWCNVIVIFDGTQINQANRTRVYINGILTTLDFNCSNCTSNMPTSIPSNVATNTSFGAQFVNSAYQRFLIGKLDDIGFWNRVLTQQEITDLYNANICYQNITVTDTLLINTGITGFNPITYKNTIKVWPNPTNDHITIDNGNIANLTGYQIKITNSLSQQVFQSAITQQQFYVDLSTWTGNGIYFVHIIDGQGNTIDIKKIVLQ